MDKSVFIIYNVYVQNTSAMAKTMFTEFSLKFKTIQANLQDAYLIGGDFNDVLDDLSPNLTAFKI